jgi:hypothetical protein
MATLAVRPTLSDGIEQVSCRIALGGVPDGVSRHRRTRAVQPCISQGRADRP